MSAPTIQRMGERALLVEVDTLAEVLTLHAALAADRPEGIIDLVPAARTVLVPFDPALVAATAVWAWIEHAWAVVVAVAAERPVEGTDAAAPQASARPMLLDIVYNGPDLVETAALLGIGPGELVERHARAEWTAAFTGFAPGFAYLTSPAWPFDVPRLGSPRTRVPAGAVGLAGGFSGAYPRETPGGWRLIGATSATLFEPRAARPALLGPGDRVRFRPVEATPGVAVRASGAASVGDAPALRVIEPGLLATVQDLGRPGHASIGVARSGALDREALRIANRLLGNVEDAAGIEVALGGFRAVAERDLWIAVTGGFGPVTIDSHPVDTYAAHVWAAGSELHIGWLDRGARAYLAVRGGIDGANSGAGAEAGARGAGTILGSRSTDTLAHLGPDPLRPGRGLSVGPPRGPVPPLDVAPWGPPPDELELELAPGPRADWFEASALRLLFEAVWTVSGAADRVGARLDGPELVRVRQGELPSEGMVPGALQVPPGGRPTVLLADGPVTGGYPVIAVVTDASLDALGQARPGTRIRFRHARPHP